jgi:hypothetical protein
VGVGDLAPRGPPWPAGYLQRSPDPSPTFAPPNTKSWIRPWILFSWSYLSLKWRDLCRGLPVTHESKLKIYKNNINIRSAFLYFLKEKFEDNKGVIRSRKSKKDSYANTVAKRKSTNNNLQNTTQKTKDWAVLERLVFVGLAVGDNVVAFYLDLLSSGSPTVWRSSWSWSYGSWIYANSAYYH